MDSFQALGLCVEALYFKIEVIFPNKQTQIYDASTKSTVDRIKALVLQSEHAVGLTYTDYLLGFNEAELLDVPEFVRFYDSSARIREALVVDDLVRIGIFHRDANLTTKEKIDLQTEIHFAEKRSVVDATLSKQPRLVSNGSSDKIDKLAEKERKREDKEAAKAAAKQAESEKAAEKAAAKAARHASSPPGALEPIITSNAKSKKFSLLNINLGLGSPTMPHKSPTSPLASSGTIASPNSSGDAKPSSSLPSASGFKGFTSTTSFSSPALLSPTLLSSPTIITPLSPGQYSASPTLHRRQSSLSSPLQADQITAPSSPPTHNKRTSRLTQSDISQQMATSQHFGHGTQHHPSSSSPSSSPHFTGSSLTLKRIPELPERKEHRLSASVGGVSSGSPVLSTDSHMTLAPLICIDAKGYGIEAGPSFLPPSFPEHCHIPKPNTTTPQERYPLAETILTANDPWYNNYFYGKDHTNYIVKPKEDDYSGPAIISALMNETDGSYRVLIRTKRADLKFNTTVLKNAKKTKLKKLPIKDIIKEVYPPLAGRKAITIKTSKEDVPSLLKYFEDKQLIRSFKFGVLYCAEGQTEEEPMFSNQGGSADWQEFLTVLGEVVPLQGWTKYRAGLDVKTGATGTHSLYTSFRGFEIMYHVSTLLPFQVDDLQRVERKRHIGNDIIVVVFKEGDQPYDPNCIKSEFNHIFIVVSKLHVQNTGGKTYYRVSIATKDGVPGFTPDLPAAGIFEKGELMHEFMLSKLINGENASYHSPAFQMKIQRTRLALLKDFEAKVS